MKDEKQEGLFDCWRKENIGISLLSEMNLNWKAVPPGQKWYDRVRKVSRGGHYSSVAYDRLQDLPSESAFQWGGCSVTLLGRPARSAKSSGCDPTGLGRWAWIKIRGKDRVVQQDPDDSNDNLDSLGPHDLVVISAYRPGLPGDSPGGVWNRQRSYWLDQGVEDDPRTKFTEDLCAEISGWCSAGCQVILGLDANEDVSLNHPGSFRQLLREVGLSEAILSRHHGPYPATQQTNSRNCPIDGIFVSSGVVVKACGYLDFHQYFNADHRALWIDFDMEATLGGPPLRPAFSPRRLSLVNAKSVKRYVANSKDGYLKFNVPRRIAALAQDMEIQGGTLTPRQVRAYDSVHRQAYDVRRKLEQRCRKLRMGGVPWSPRLQRLWDRLYLWKLLLKGFRGLRTSSRKIRRLMKKTGLKDAWKKSEVDVQSALVQARTAYREAKKQKASKWRKNYIQVRSTAPRVASRWLAKARACVSTHQRIEQKEETRRRRAAQGKGFSGGLIQIKVPTDPLDEESPWLTCTSRRNVEMGCMWENTLRYDQTRHPFPTPPTSEPLYSMFNGPDAESNSRSLLQGSLPYPSDDPFVRSFVDQCRRPPYLQDLPLRVSLDDHCYFWSRMKESKGSEPHGLHNGHFKAAVSSPMLSSCDATF